MILSGNITKPKLIVELQIDKACQKCGYPAIINNKHVGDICPQCGSQRPKSEFRSYTYGSFGERWWRFKEKIKNIGRKY